MTKDEIAKLLTPETDEVHYGCAIYDDDISRYRDMAEHAQTIERKLAAAVMALEAMEMETRKGAQWTTEEINECARETLTAIRGDK